MGVFSWKPYQELVLVNCFFFSIYCTKKKSVYQQSGHEIAPNTVANATKITALATKIQKLVAKLATRTLYVLAILP